MSDHEKSEHVTNTVETSEGEYTDVETESGRDTHKNDVVPGEYTDVETESGRDTHADDGAPGEYTDSDLGEDGA